MFYIPWLWLHRINSKWKLTRSEYLKCARIYWPSSRLHILADNKHLDSGFQKRVQLNIPNYLFTSIYSLKQFWRRAGSNDMWHQMQGRRVAKSRRAYEVYLAWSRIHQTVRSVSLFHKIYYWSQTIIQNAVFEVFDWK